MADIEALREALTHVDNEGFGDLVNVDSIIEDAAHEYLALLAEREAGNRTHFVMDDGYDERNLLVNVTDEGVIMDAFLNGDHIGTSAMMADELFESIATTEETN